MKSAGEWTFDAVESASISAQKRKKNGPGSWARRCACARIHASCDPEVIVRTSGLPQVSIGIRPFSRSQASWAEGICWFHV